jgi:hypothetical protein
MSDVVIRAEKLSKLYRIGQREKFTTLRDVIARTFTAPFRRWFKNNQNEIVPNPQSPAPITTSGRSKMFPLKSSKEKLLALLVVTAQEKAHC